LGKEILQNFGGKTTPLEKKYKNKRFNVSIEVGIFSKNVKP
jgi:hypothetical protein